jgi:uncharacterized protein YprB with RNaseH-like and TPR domain
LIQSKPHVHAVMLVRPEHLTRFKDIESKVKKTMREDWLCVPFERREEEKQKSLEHLISYCMKGYQRAPLAYAEREDLWDVYPR